jgi:hypothetical protein
VTPVDALVMAIVWFPVWGPALAVLIYRSIRSLRAERRAAIAFYQRINTDCEAADRAALHLPVVDTTRGTDELALARCRAIWNASTAHRRNTGPREEA